MSEYLSSGPYAYRHIYWETLKKIAWPSISFAIPIFLFLVLAYLASLLVVTGGYFFPNIALSIWSEGIFVASASAATAVFGLEVLFGSTANRGHLFRKISAAAFDSAVTPLIALPWTLTALLISARSVQVFLEDVPPSGSDVIVVLYALVACLVITGLPTAREYVFSSAIKDGAKVPVWRRIAVSAFMFLATIAMMAFYAMENPQ